MLYAFLEMILSLLAVLGLLSLGWVLFGRLLSPGRDAAPVFAVVPAGGDGAALEQAVRGLLWLRGGEHVRCTVVIADAGLTPDGVAVAQKLAQREPGILLCAMDEVAGILGGAGR